MKKKKLFKNKVQMVIYITLFIIFIGLFIYIGQIDFKKDEDSEAKKFSSLYNLVPDNNLYVFCDASDVLDILKGRSGIVLMAFPSNKWSNKYASLLNEVATSLGVDKICYYDFKSDRDESNGTYETVVNTLSVYAPVDDDGVQNIYAPTVIVVKHGDVIGYFDETSIIKGSVTPDLYYNAYQEEITKDIFKNTLAEYMKVE